MTSPGSPERVGDTIPPPFRRAISADTPEDPRHVPPDEIVDWLHLRGAAAAGVVNTVSHRYLEAGKKTDARRRGEEEKRVTSGELIPAERIARSILVVRGHKVLLDAELAALYGVATKRLNEQVKRNRERFPEDFAFRLTPAEVEELNRSQSATGPQKHRDPRFPPWVFTEHGALAAAFVLNSPRAIAVGEVVVRAFVKLREFVSSHHELAQRLEALECKVGSHDEDLRAVYGALQRLLEATPPLSKRRRIGFHEAAEKPGKGKRTAGRSKKKGAS